MPSSASARMNPWISSIERLLERVRDEDDALAAIAEPAQKIEEVLFLLGRERGSRLVEDDDARLVVDGARDLHHLLLRGAQVGDVRRGIDVQTGLPSSPSLRRAREGSTR